MWFAQGLGVGDGWHPGGGWNTALSAWICQYEGICQRESIEGGEILLAKQL